MKIIKLGAENVKRLNFAGVETHLRPIKPEPCKPSSSGDPSAVVIEDGEVKS